MRVEKGEIELEAGEILMRPGIFTTVGDEVHLVGRKCPNCGDISFPPYRRCLNCDTSAKTEEFVLGNRALLYSYTQAHMVTPGFEPGYILAWVAMQDDPTVRITAQLTDCSWDDLKPGMELEMIPKVTRETIQGYKVVTYTFKPVEK